jgi:hypothetical protein
MQRKLFFWLLLLGSLVVSFLAADMFLPDRLFPSGLLVCIVVIIGVAFYVLAGGRK